MIIENDSAERKKTETQQNLLRRQITKFMIGLMIIGAIAALVAGVIIANP